MEQLVTTVNSQPSRDCRDTIPEDIELTATADTVPANGPPQTRLEDLKRPLLKVEKDCFGKCFAKSGLKKCCCQWCDANKCKIALNICLVAAAILISISLILHYSVKASSAAQRIAGNITAVDREKFIKQKDAAESAETGAIISLWVALVGLLVAGFFFIIAAKDSGLLKAERFYFLSEGHYGYADNRIL